MRESVSSLICVRSFRRVWRWAVEIDSAINIVERLVILAVLVGVPSVIYGWFVDDPWRFLSLGIIGAWTAMAALVAGVRLRRHRAVRVAPVPRPPISAEMWLDHREVQDKAYDAERRTLITSGEHLAQDLRGIADCPPEEPDSGTAAGLAHMGREWIIRADGFWNTWHSSLTMPNTMAIVGEMAYLQGHPAPGPEWRRRLTLRIEYRLDRLRNQR